jgi:carbon monoxide dehydrogenase subunit G
LRVEDTVDIGKPQELVYALVRDLRRAPEWQGSLEYVDVEKGFEVRRFAGRTQRATFFVQDDDPPRRLVISSEGGPARARAEFDFEPHGDGTRVTFALEVDLRGPARFAGGVMRPAAQREVAASLQKLKELAES